MPRERKGVRPEPPGGEPPEAWLPETAQRRDTVYAAAVQKAGSAELARERELDSDEIYEAAHKYQVPGNAPLSIAATLAKRDPPHAMTLPGFAISRWPVYVAGRPIVVNQSFTE